MQCKGKILGFSTKAGGGIIGFDDGSMRVFHVQAWQHVFPPIKSLPVRMVVDNSGNIVRIQALPLHYWCLRMWRWLLRRPVLVYSTT